MRVKSACAHLRLHHDNSGIKVPVRHQLYFYIMSHLWSKLFYKSQLDCYEQLYYLFVYKWWFCVIIHCYSHAFISCEQISKFPECCRSFLSVACWFIASSQVQCRIWWTMVDNMFGEYDIQWHGISNWTKAKRLYRNVHYSSRYHPLESRIIHWAFLIKWG